MKRVIKRFIKKFHRGEKGFTLIELLVVIAIIGVIAGVVVPNVGKFMNRGKTEAYAAELHNVQTATMAMMADSDTGLLDSTNAAVAVDPTTATATLDMDDVETTDGYVLSDYLTGLDVDNKVKNDCSYRFGTDGTVLQTTP